MKMQKEFSVLQIMNIITSVLISQHNEYPIEDVYEILDFMFGYEHSTFELPKACDNATPFLLEQFPFLAKYSEITQYVLAETKHMADIADARSLLEYQALPSNDGQELDWQVERMMRDARRAIYKELITGFEYKVAEKFGIQPYYMVKAFVDAPMSGEDAMEQLGHNLNQLIETHPNLKIIGIEINEDDSTSPYGTLPPKPTR